MKSPDVLTASGAYVGSGDSSPEPRVSSVTIMHKGVPRVLIFDYADTAVIELGWHIIEPKPGAFYAAKSRPTRYLHRVLLGFFAGDSREADHANGNGLDNRRANLRQATRSQQQCNRGKPVTSLRRFKGVQQRGLRFRACIQVSGVHVCIGTFDTEIEAALAYNAKAIELHGEFARLNIIPVEVSP